MPNKQKHRGMNSRDFGLFSNKYISKLKQGTEDLSWLISRGYSNKAALALVGDRYQLHLRQRHSIQRASCARNSLEKRKEKELSCKELKGRNIHIDGYNLLILIESALSGGIMIFCQDGLFS